MEELKQQIRNYPTGTEFQKMVWLELLNIPVGSVITYLELARKVGKPKSYRAVANAVGANPFAPEVPCHRVIRSDGRLGGYSGEGGVETKLKLLRSENVDFSKLIE